MSGFEIAGIALAVLPMALKAFDVYKDYFPSSKKVEEDLRQLVQDLNSEKLRIHNIYERLLASIWDQTTTARELLKDPNSPKWQELGPEIDARLRTLLGGMYNMFQEQLEQFGKASEKLRVKLKLPDPQVDPTYNELQKHLIPDKRSILKAWAARTGFSLRKKSYNDIIKQMQQSNTLLEGFTNTAVELSAPRTLRAKDHATSLLRDLLKSLFMALGDASSDCACTKPHDVYLELVSRKDLWFSKESESEEAVARGKIDFHLVLNSVSFGHAAGDRSLRLQPRWVAVRVQCCNFDPSSPPLLSPTSPSGSTTSLPNLTTALSHGQQPSPKLGKVKFTGRSSLPAAILMSQRPHHDPLNPPPAGSTTSLLSYMSGGPVGPISSAPEDPRPASSGKFKFRGPLTKLPAQLLERSSKSGKKVAFSIGSSTSVATLAKTSISSFTSLEPTKLVTICDITVSNKGKKQASPFDQDYCHGCIVARGQGRKFALYPPRQLNDSDLKIQQQSLAEPFEFRATFTLRQILDSDQQRRYRVPKPTIADRIRMAVAISASVLHMDSTPWLSKPLTLDDIVFLVDKSSTTSEIFQLRPFISKPTAHGSATCSSEAQERDAAAGKIIHHDGGGRNPTITPSPAYPTTFYLGLLLCQLMLEENRTPAIEPGIDLKAHLVPVPPGAAVVPNRIHKRLSQKAGNLYREIQDEASVEYKNLVEWCIGTYKSEKGLDDEDFRKLFYTKVVEELRVKFQAEVYGL